MLVLKEVLADIVRKKVKEQLFAPYPGVEKLTKSIEAGESKEDFENLDLFYFGNIEKRNLKKELRELRNHKPDFVVDFIEGIEAISLSGENISSNYKSIYFTIKKENNETSN